MIENPNIRFLGGSKNKFSNQRVKTVISRQHWTWYISLMLVQYWFLMAYLLHRGWDKMLCLADYIFKCIFLTEQIFLSWLDQILLQRVQFTKKNSIASEIGLAPDRWQAIIWTDDGLVSLCIYASLHRASMTYTMIQTHASWIENKTIQWQDLCIGTRLQQIQHSHIFFFFKDANNPFVPQSKSRTQEYVCMIILYTTICNMNICHQWIEIHVCRVYQWECAKDGTQGYYMMIL